MTPAEIAASIRAERAAKPRVTRDEILQLHLLTAHLSNLGVELKRSGGELVTNRCPLTTHKPGHNCVSIEPEKQVWNCHDCGQGGSLIDWIMAETGRSASEVLKELSGQSEKPTGKPQIVATYDYADATGKLIFQVVRMQPKSFRQRQPDGHGDWKWGLDGITRVLFNLPKVLASQTVLVLEGEKDCQSAETLGLTATTNAGGSNGWLNAYADSLKGKDVIVIPDNDAPGEKHAEVVVKSLGEKANSIKVMRVPPAYKDLSDWIGSFLVPEAARKAISDLIDYTPHTVAPAPLYSMAEMEVIYRDFVRRSDANSLDLAKFLPELGAKTRKLMPGELVLILADTGVGKTAIMQGLARSAGPLPTLFFELELPMTLMFRRFVQIETSCFAHEVERDYKSSDERISDRFKGLQHIIVCPESGITPAQIESYIGKSELKFGMPPIVVCVDYIGLLKKGNTRSRYEAISDNAEQMKVIAKRTGTIIVLGSQIARPADKKESKDVALHDAKDSGALENSAGLILGCWRPDANHLSLRILKNTDGYSGDIIKCDFDGPKMQITQSANQGDEDDL